MGAPPATQIGIGQSSRADLGATDQDLFISQSLDIFGRSQANRRLGDAGILSAEANRKQVLLDVQSEVIARFYEATAALQHKQSADSLLAIAESLLNATQRRYEEGKIPEVQVTRATIERDRSVQTALLRASQLKSALTRLAGAIGTTSLISNPDPSSMLAHIDSFDINLRPDLLARNAELAAAEAELTIAKRSTMPELEVVGLRSPWRGEETHFGARLQLTWSVFDFGKRKFESAAAQSKANAVRAQIADVQQLAESEIRAIQNEFDATNERISSYRTLLELNRILVQKTQLGFDQGVGTLIDVLEASRSLREIEQELAEAQLAANLSLAELYRATGTLVEVNK